MYLGCSGLLSSSCVSGADTSGHDVWCICQGAGVGRLSLELIAVSILGVTGPDWPWAGNWTGRCSGTFAGGREVLRPRISASKVFSLLVCAAKNCSIISHSSSLETAA